MTPFSDAEAGILAQVAVLRTEVDDLKNWRRGVDEHDDRQDRALYRVESDVRMQRADMRNLIEGQTNNRKKLNKIFALCIPAALDATGWNIWRYAGPYIKQYMNEQFFWFVISSLMLCSIVYAFFSFIPWLKRKKPQPKLSIVPKENNDEEEDEYAP